VKNIRLHHTVFPLFLLLVAAFLRLILLRSNWPVTNSDEGTLDLMALHIARDYEHPIFFYGQHYMGTIQAYLGAVMIKLFGVSVFSVRLGTLLLFLLSLLCLYYVTNLLYSQKFALAILALLCFGSVTLIATPLIALGGYAETLLFGALIYLLTCWLALTAPDASQQIRLLVYAILGCVVGLALWSDQLILPCVVTAGGLLLLFCWRDIRTWAAVSLLAGLVVGLLPLISYNLTAVPGQDTFHVLLYTSGLGAPRVVPLLQQLAQVFLISLPAATAANPLCKVAEPFHPVGNLTSFFTSRSPWQCILWQGGWSLGVIVLWCYATIRTATIIRQHWQRMRSNPLKTWSREERQCIVRHAARLMLLVSAALSFALFAESYAAGHTPQSSARYLLCLLLATPALLWPFWPYKERNKIHIAFEYKYIKMLPLLVILILFIHGTAEAFLDIPTAQKTYDKQETLIQHLLSLNITRMYTDYWTCNRLIFQSDEHIICSSLNPQLKPDLDRYPPYRAAVRATPHPAYVFPLHSIQAATLERTKLTLGVHYQRTVFDGYLVYYYG